MANNYYQKERQKALRNNRHFKGNGIKNTFLCGYLDGIKESLEKQCTALMLVVPKKVEDEYIIKTSGFKNLKNTIKEKGNAAGINAKKAGIIAGKNAVASRSIESI